MTDTTWTSTIVNEDGTTEQRTFTGPRLTLEKLAEVTAPGFDIDQVEVGDALAVTKDHRTRQMTVLSVADDSDYAPYILAKDAQGTVVGFDRISLRYGIVTVEWA